MTDETVVDDVVESPKSNPEEVKARSFGWVPKEDWVDSGKDAEDWKPARQFNKDSELYGKINRQSQENVALKSKLNDVEKALQTLSEHHVKVAQQERDKVLRELKKQKVEALREDDLEVVVEIDEKIAEIKQEVKEEARQPQSPNVNPVIDQWLKNPDNNWYHEDFDLRDEADRYFEFLTKTKKASSLEDALRMTEQRMKSKHPDKFGEAPVQVETPKRVNKVIEQDDSVSPRKSSPQKKYTLRNLNESDRIVVKHSAKAAGVSEQEYVDILAAQGYFE